MTPSPFATAVTDILGGGTPVRFRASGSSMAPAIRDGDLLTVEPAARSLRVGDIVLYSSGERLRAHRVRDIDRRRKLLICKGDNWFCTSEIISEGDVRGIVVGVANRRVVLFPRLAAWVEFFPRYLWKKAENLW